MTLHSEFDRLGYLCEECDFSLHESLKLSINLFLLGIFFDTCFRHTGKNIMSPVGHRQILLLILTRQSCQLRLLPFHWDLLGPSFPANSTNFCFDRIRFSTLPVSHFRWWLVERLMEWIIILWSMVVPESPSSTGILTLFRHFVQRSDWDRNDGYINKGNVAASLRTDFLSR